MPIGAYQPWICSHCTPEQAVQMANAAGAKKFLPIHFKTFPLGREGVIEPMERLEKAIEKERIAWRTWAKLAFFVRGSGNGPHSPVRAGFRK